MRHWLFKSEPDTYSIQQLRKDGTTSWTGVRSFQARNNMMEMQLGDLGLFYHSSIAEPAAVGICKVVKTSHPDPTQYDRGGEYFDGRATDAKPLWYLVDVGFVEEFAQPVTLARMRAEPRLMAMPLLRRGQRLSVQPVAPHEWNVILELSQA